MATLLSLDGIASWQDLANYFTTESGDNWIGTLLTSISWVLWVALIIVGAAGAVYAIYVGVKMARAESSDQREEAKKRLINIIVSIVVTIALILFFNILLPVILNAFGVFDNLVSTEGQSIQNSGNAIATMLNTAKVMLRI